MSIESISPKIDPQIVKAPDGAHRPEQQKQERSPAPMDKSDASQSLSEERKQEAVDGFMSDFAYIDNNLPFGLGKVLVASLREDS